MNEQRPCASPPTLTKVRVWDLPTRVFHWVLVLCVIGQAITGSLGGSAMVWHFRFGYAVLTLLLFRLTWGLVGGRWSRFAAFIFSPRSVLNYIRRHGKPEHDVGHTPLGAVSVFAMLGFLLVQVATGLMSDDEISFAGPLTRFVSNATISLATDYHGNFGKWILLVLVALHLAAIIFHVRRKQRLVGAMLHGDKMLELAATPSRDDWVSRTVALFLLAACAAVAYWVSRLDVANF